MSKMGPYNRERVAGKIGKVMYVVATSGPVTSREVSRALNGARCNDAVREGLDRLHHIGVLDRRERQGGGNPFEYRLADEPPGVVDLTRIRTDAEEL